MISTIVPEPAGHGSATPSGSAVVRLSVPDDHRWSRNLTKELEPEGAQLMDTIHRHWISRQGDETGFVHLKYDLLRQHIPNVANVRDRLVSSRVIDVNETYVPGVRSMSYRIMPEFRQTHVQTFEDAALARRLARSRAKRERQLLPVQRRLQEHLALPDFDLERALRKISRINAVPPKRRKQALNLADYQMMLSEQCRAFHEELTFETPEINPDDHGRLHSSFSRLPGIVRGCLSINGEPLVGCDLANAQPLMLGLIAVGFLSCRKTRQRLLTYKPLDKNPYGRQREGREREALSITMTGRKLQTHTGKGVYENRLCHAFEYLEVCEAGQLYQSLSTSRLSAESVKRSLLIEMNAKVDSDLSPVMKRFKQDHPIDYEVMTALKEDNHRRLSWILQNQEARLIIGRVCRRLLDESPEIPLLTIYDSIMTTPGHFETVKRVAQEEFAAVGLNPTFKRETYT